MHGRVVGRRRPAVRPSEPVYGSHFRHACQTPFGAIYTTNITPDSQTGIGGYTEQDFARAMREGVAKDGHNLYPAMPYPSYAKVNDDDVWQVWTWGKYSSGQLGTEETGNRATPKKVMGFRHSGAIVVP